jgi:hypothetical protein
MPSARKCSAASATQTPAVTHEYLYRFAVRTLKSYSQICFVGSTMPSGFSQVQVEHGFSILIGQQWTHRIAGVNLQYVYRACGSCIFQLFNFVALGVQLITWQLIVI